MSAPTRATHRRPPGHHRLKNVLVGLFAALAVIALTLAIAWVLTPRALETVPPSGALEAVNVSGRVGATPTVTVLREITVTGVKAKETEVGSGRTITVGAPVLLSVTAFNGKTGENLSPGGRPELMSGATTDVLGEDISSIVVGRTEGTRLVALHPVPATSHDEGVEINVIDILPTVATGEPIDEDGPLRVQLTPEGPVFSHDPTPPGGLTVQTLLKGDGVQVLKTDRIVAQFTVVGWNDGNVRSSTWQTGSPELVNLATVMKGLREALVDQRVGSRLAMTIPPDLATGEDTLCVVIDILGTEDGSSDTQSIAPPQSGAL